MFKSNGFEPVDLRYENPGELTEPQNSSDEINSPLLGGSGGPGKWVNDEEIMRI